MAWFALSVANALAHFALIAVLILGGPLTLRRRRFAWVHIPSLVSTGVVFAAHADCPFTTWQKACLRRSGRVPYEGGFVEHYLVTPLTGGKITPEVRMMIFAAWIVPTVVSYVLLLVGRRWARAGSFGDPRPA